MPTLTIKDFRAGVVALAVFVGAFLWFAPAGRALVFVLTGIAPDTPRTTVEGWIGGPGEATLGNFCCFFGKPGSGQADIDNFLEQSRQSRQVYSGPLYLAVIEYKGHLPERVVQTHLQPDISAVGILLWLALSATPMAAAFAHRTWRLRRVGQSSPIPTTES